MRCSEKLRLLSGRRLSPSTLNLRASVGHLPPVYAHPTVWGNPTPCYEHVIQVSLSNMCGQVSGLLGEREAS